MDEKPADPRPLHCNKDPQQCRGESYCSCQCAGCKMAYSVAPAWYAAKNKIDLHKELPLSPLPPETLALRETFAKYYEGGGGGGVSEDVVPVTVTADEFGKIELRVGTIVAAEAIKKANKMLKLSVDLGEAAPRTILAGIAKSFAPEKLVGGRYVFVTNLPPREMFGLKSEGMILATGDAPSHVLVRPDGEAPNGSRFH